MSTQTGTQVEAQIESGRRRRRRGRCAPGQEVRSAQGGMLYQKEAGREVVTTCRALSRRRGRREREKAGT